MIIAGMFDDVPAILQGKETNMLSLLSPEKIASVLAVLMIINACLSGLSVALNKLVDLGEVKPDSKIVKIISMIAAPLAKLIDILSANVKH
jgi:hypothetical protein